MIFQIVALQLVLQCSQTIPVYHVKDHHRQKLRKTKSRFRNGTYMADNKQTNFKPEKDSIYGHWLMAET